MPMHEIAETIQNLSVNTAFACAAGVGGVVVAYGILRVAKLIAKGERKLAAVSLGAALMVGGMAVIGTDDAGTKPGTNVVNQVEGGTNTVGQTEGGTNDWTNIEGTNIVGQTDGEGTNGTGSVSGPLTVGLFGRPNFAQGMQTSITDDDIAFGWRVASVSSNVLATATFTMPTNATVWESAQASGRGHGAWRIPLDGWHFTYGDVGWTNGFAWVEGYFRSRFNSRANEIRLLSERLTLCPAANWSRYNLAASRAWCATNGEDGLIVTFEGAAVGDDPTKIANVQMELFPRTGEVALRYDLANVGDATYTAGLVIDGTNRFVEVGAGTREVVFQRVHPDDWDMDGIPNSIDDTPMAPSFNTGYNQTDAWAMAAFPSNSAEIATMGYAAWAAVRAADPNRRLIGLHISSPNNAWPVCLTFGGKQVMCDGNAEVVFALDCGAKYAFSISDGEVSEINVLTINGVEHAYGSTWFGFPVEHMLGDMTVHWDAPGRGWVCRKADVVLSEPDAGHLFQNDSCEISATVTNCMDSALVECHWIGGEGISFSDPNSLCTTMTYQQDPLPDFATNAVMLVTAYEGGYAITNSYFFTVGHLAEPQTEFSMSCPEVMFLNDDPIVTNYLERVYRVSLSLRAPEGVGGTAVVTSSGETGSQIFLDEGRTMPIGPGRIALDISNGGGYASDFTYTTNVYLISPHVGNGAIQATLSLSNGGGTREEAKAYRVIEPLRELVTTNKYCGRIVNPACIVFGTNAVLSVGIGEGSPFSPTNVVWSVVSNSPGRIVAIDGWHAIVEPTASSGEVMVEARFNNDEIQPCFVLPIVEPREIPVKAFIVEPPSQYRYDEWKDDEIDVLIQQANRIYEQIGVSFRLEYPVRNIDDSTYWHLATYDVYTNSVGEVSVGTSISEQAWNLFSGYSTNDCVELYFVGEVTSAGVAAFWSRSGIAVDKAVNANILAHELGHALGLVDCYWWRPVVINGREEIAGLAIRDNPVFPSLFESRRYDWGLETGHGFYRKNDSVKIVHGRLLMYGVKSLNQVDIPECRIYGLRRDLVKGFLDVGYENVKKSNQEVYSE